jgi:hypothetical protein
MYVSAGDVAGGRQLAEVWHGWLPAGASSMAAYIATGPVRTALRPAIRAVAVMVHCYFYIACDTDPDCGQYFRPIKACPHW